MSEGILTREEVEGLPLDLSGWSTLDIITTALALYDSQAADRERIAALERALERIDRIRSDNDREIIDKQTTLDFIGQVARAALQATPPQEE